MCALEGGEEEEQEMVGEVKEEKALRKWEVEKKEVGGEGRGVGEGGRREEKFLIHKYPWSYMYAKQRKDEFIIIIIFQFSYT